MNLLVSITGDYALDLVHFDVLVVLGGVEV